METLRIFQAIDSVTKKGYICLITYGDKILSTFDVDKGKIDLSVLNPFVNKNAKFIKFDTITKDTQIDDIVITDCYHQSKLGYVFNFEYCKDNKQKR